MPMGPEDEDDQGHVAECHRFIDILHAEHIVLPGGSRRRIYRKMDMTILTSISEGRFLTILRASP